MPDQKKRRYKKVKINQSKSFLKQEALFKFKKDSISEKLILCYAYIYGK